MLMMLHVDAHCVHGGQASQERQGVRLNAAASSKELIVASVSRTTAMQEVGLQGGGRGDGA